MEDKELIDLFFARKESAVTELKAKYEKSLNYIATHLVNYEDAEECVNDTYMSAWNSIPPNRPENLKAWLLRVCRNHALDKIAYQKAEKRTASFVEIDDELSECIADPNAPEVGDDCELGELMNIFLDKQKKSRRIMFVQRYFYGLSVAEIAEKTGLKESNIKTSLHRMREELRSFLNTEGIKV